MTSAMSCGQDPSPVHLDEEVGECTPVGPDEGQPGGVRDGLLLGQEPEVRPIVHDPEQGRPGGDRDGLHHEDLRPVC